MTFEHKLLVGFNEIKAVVFECNQCRVRTSIPIEQFTRPPLTCAQQHVWNTNRPTIDNKTALDALVMLLKYLSAEDFSRSAGFNIFLEFDAEKLG